MHGSSAAYWVLSGRTYLPTASVAVPTELRRLYPARCWTIGERQRPMSPIECYEVVGHRVDTVILDMSARRPTVRDDVAILPCCVPVDVEAERSEIVDGWLQVLGGSEYERLCDWIAYSGDVDRPIAALYLDGEPGTGKGMLVDALAALWGGARVSYADVVLSSFNEGLTASPVVHLDERAPKDIRQQGSAGFRSLVGESARTLTLKGRPSATIRGCPRLVVTANGPDALRIGGEDLTPADEQAIGRRILRIQVHDDARCYLEELGGRTRTQGWVDHDGALTRHLRWLQLHHDRAAPGLRFLVEGDSGAWLRGAARRDGLPRDVLVALAVAGSGQHGIDADKLPCEWRDGAAWVSVTRLRDTWERLTGGDRVPTFARLGGALARVGTRHHIGTGQRQWVYRVPVAPILAAAEDAGVGDPDRILRIAGREDG
jgi:hypothetical protein